MVKVVLVSIAIGEKYIKEYEFLFKESHTNYASKQGYDFRLITEYLSPDNEDRVPANICMQKFLLCSQEWSQDYDFLVYVDADILININAPPIHACTDYGDKIGLIDEYSQPSKERRIQIQRKMGWETSAKDYYKMCNFDINTDMVFNGGVSVLQPNKHRAFFRAIYDKHIKESKTHPRGFHFEQSCVGYYTQKEQLCKVLDNKFNAIWFFAKHDIPALCLEDFFKQNYFIHFAGKIDYDRIFLIHNLYNKPV